MKAAVFRSYGSPDVLKIENVEKPTPKDDEVLVKVHATTVTIGDTIMRSFNLPVSGLQKLLARLYAACQPPLRG